MRQNIFLDKNATIVSFKLLFLNKNSSFPLTKMQIEIQKYVLQNQKLWRT